MRRCSIVLASVALCFFLGSHSTSAQDAKDAPTAPSDPWYNPKKYNPVKLFKRGPKSANDQLASNGDLEVKLTHQFAGSRDFAARQTLAGRLFRF